MSWKEAVWKNGSKRTKGRWVYNWSSDTFTIQLESKDRVTGCERTLRVHGDRPEWGNWKILDIEQLSGCEEGDE